MKKHLLLIFAFLTAATLGLNAQTIVIDDGFENGIQDSVWTQEYVAGHTPWMVESVEDGLSWPATVKQGTHRAYLRNTTGETQGYVTRLVSKVMDLSPRKVYQPELSFWYANPKWTSDRDTLRVLYRNNVNGKWKQLAEFSTAMANWQKVTLELPEVGATYQIAFEGSDNPGRGIVLDSIKLRSAPECTVPHDIFVSNKGSNRVNIAWAASWDAINFELIVSKDTINLDNLDNLPESQIAFHGLISGLQQNYDLTLESGELYYVYIRSICENETSLWSSERTEEGPYKFRVRATKQVPFSENFNWAKTKTQDPEWSWGNNMGKTTPYVNSKTTSASELSKYSPTATPAVMFSGGTATAKVTPGSYVYLATPALADTTNEDFHLNQCQVHFWSTVHIYTGRTYGRSLIVGVMDDPDDITTLTPIDTVMVWGNQTFVENIVDLSSYTGSGAYIGFVSNFDRQNLFYIDDISIEYRPEVNKVTKISVNPRDTFATISWEGNAPSYNVLITNAEVDPTNPSAEAIVDQATVTTNSYVCNSLEAFHSWNHPYYVYVQAVGADWSYRYPFVTLASQREVPYTFDFEPASGRYQISGSTYYAANLGIFGNDPKYPSLVSANVYKGSGCLSMNKTAGADTWITLPMVEDLDSVQVKFFLGGTSTTYAKAHATVGVMTNPMDINTFTKVSSFTLNTSGYTMCYANFKDYTGPKDGVIAIVWDDIRGMGENTINYIDELKVEKLSECTPPQNVELEVASDSITISWSASQQSMWEVAISRSPLTTAQKDKTFAEIAAMGAVVYADTLDWWDETTAPEFGIGGLKSKTDYVLYVRTVCGGDAAWWTELPFSTPCPNAGFPYKETFESCTSTSSNAAPQLPCWQMVNYLGTSYPWIYAANGGKTLELWTSGTSYRCVAIMPPVEGDLSTMMLTFETRSYSSGATASSVLYVGTMGDIDNQNSFVPFDTIYNTGGTAFQKVTLLLSDYNLAYDNIAFSSGFSGSSDVLIDNIELKDASCIEAYNFRQTDAQENSADFQWDGLTANDQWELRVLSTNVSLANAAAGNYDTTNVAIVNDTVITGRTFHVEGLKPVSTYYVYIRALCGDSIWTVDQVQTACEKLDPNRPNKETFENYASGTSYSDNYQAPCWTVGNDGTTSTSYIPYIYKSTSYSNSGQNSYRLYGYEYYDYVPAYIVSPEIDCTHMKDLAVTFNMYAGTSYSWLCGVMTDPNDLSTFVVLDSLKGTGESKQYTYDLSEYEDSIPATARYFAWRTPYDATSYAYLDDISIMKMNCPFTKPTYSDLTAQSVRIASGLRTDNDWILLVSNQQLNTDSLLSSTYRVPADYIVFRDTLDVRSQRVNGLSEQTKYYAYTASYCDSAVSQWSAISFITPCLPIKPESMKTITFATEDGYITGSSADRYLPCWTIGSKTQGLSASSSYYPYVDASTKYNGHNSLRIYDYVYGTSSNYVGAYAIMPELFVDSISKYQVTFWGRRYSSSYNGQLIIGIVSDPSDLNTFVAVDTVTMNNTTWEPFSVGMETYEGDFLGNLGRNIMFLSEFGVTNGVYITDINVELIPTCRPISSFKVDSIGENAAIVSWRGYQDSYRLLVADRVLSEEEKPTYAYLIDSIVTSSDRVLLENLNATTNYFVYAQGICGDGDSTSISMQYAGFRTECPVSTGVPLPFFEDFDSYPAGNSDVGCWLFRNVSGTTYPKVEAARDGMTTNTVDLYSPASGGRSWIVVPVINGSLADLKLEFDARTWSSSASATQYIHVGTIADPDDPTTYVELASFPLTGSTQMSHFEMILGEYEIPYERLVFTSGLDATMASCDVSIDNISLTIESPCHAPKIKANSVSFNAVELEIVPSKAENDLWHIVCLDEAAYTKIKNIDRYLDTLSTYMSVDTTFVTISNLEPATSYYIFARTACGGIYGNSPWSKMPLNVHTKFYFKEGYHFGFEKSEMWERSLYSTNDNYYIHPALVTGRDTLGAASISYAAYPYSIENTASYLYAHTGTGALTINASGNYFGGYVIFPAVDYQLARSFELKIRPGYVAAATEQAAITYNGVLEIGTIDKNKSFDTYQRLATIRLDALDMTVKADSTNNYFFSNYTIDLDEELIASKQIVLHAPQQPAVSSMMYIDEVIMGETKGYSLVSINKVNVSGSTATIEWDSIGGPWNLYIKDEAGDVVSQYLNLTANSQFVENLASRTQYTAVLEAANADDKSIYVTTSSYAFETTCQVMQPDANGEFAWDFDDPYEWEPNDVLAGTTADSAYMKPNCFHVGITYDTPSNGYQWLVQRKGFDYYSTLMNYNADRHFEVGRTDSHALRVHTSATNFNSYLVLPEMNCNFDTMMIEFYGRCFVNYDEEHATVSSRGKIVNASYLGAEYSHSIVVGTLTDPNDFSTLQVLDTLTYKQTNLTNSDNVNDDPAGLRYWELMQLPLAGAQGRYIVLFQPAYGLFFLDDLSIKPVRNTLFAPTHLQTADVTATSATLNWDKRHADLPSVVVVSNAANEEILRDTVTTNVYPLANLEAGRSYRWFVYQTDNGNNSPASVVLTFATECVSITPAYTCGFEPEEGWAAIPGQTAYTQALCWTYSDAEQTEWTSGTYDPQNQPNTENYRYSRTDSAAVFMRAYYSTYGTTYQPYIAMPAMDITAYDTLQVTFWMRPAYVRQGTGVVASQYTGSTYSKSVIVGTMTDPNDASTFVAMDTVTYDGTLTVADVATAANDYLFQQKKVELVGANGPYVAFMTSFYAKGDDTRKSGDYIWLDDIAFSRRQLCKDPHDLSNDRIGATDATLSWQGGDNVFVLQVSTDPYFAEDTAFVFNDTVYSNPFTVTGLANQTTYAWRVQAICSESNEASGFSAKETFKTLRSPYFYEAFNSAVSTSEWTFSSSKADDILNKTTVTFSSDNSYGFKRVSNNYGLQGSHYTSVGYYVDYNWMITPEFYLPENDSVHISMDLALTACNSSHAATANAVSEADMANDFYLMLIVSEDGGDTWKRENIIAKWQNTNPAGQQLRDISATGQNVRFSLAQYAGKNIRVALYREAKTSVSTGIAVHVDNIRLAYFDKIVDYTTACQYEDITIGDIHLSGDDTQPGLHIYPTSFYATDEDARLGARDTVYSLEIDVFETAEENITATICEGETYTDLNFHGKDQTGVYKRKLQSVHGCDSIVVLHLTVLPIAYGEDTEVALCPGETFNWHGVEYNRAGIYRDTLQAVNGCDSIETLVISYLSVEDTIFVSRTVYVDELPFTYSNDNYPYAVGQAPIYFAEGTPKGVYTDTVKVQGEQCNTVLVLTTTIDWHQGIDQAAITDEQAAVKVLIDGQIYIILNGNWYNAAGQQVDARW